MLKGTTGALQILQICFEVMRSSFELNHNKTVVIKKGSERPRLTAFSEDNKKPGNNLVR